MQGHILLPDATYSPLPLPLPANTSTVQRSVKAVDEGASRKVKAFEKIVCERTLFVGTRLASRTKTSAGKLAEWPGG